MRALSLVVTGGLRLEFLKTFHRQDAKSAKKTLNINPEGS